MAKVDVEAATQQFLDRVEELQALLDAFYEKTETGWADTADFLQAARDLGKAGSRVYNATTKMAGGSPFDLDLIIRELKEKRSHE